MTTLTRADRRLALRLVVGLAVTAGVDVPVLLLALMIRRGWDPLLDLDTSVAEHLHSVAVANPSLVTFMDGVSVVLGPWVLRPVVTVLGLVLLARRRYRVGAWVLVTLWLGALLGVVLKEVVDRARPDLLDPVATAPGRSFPSGHALGATIACGLLALVLGELLPRGHRRLTEVVAGLAVVLVCLARVTLGVHYLSDVTAGVVVGLGWLAVTAAAFHAWRRDAGLPPVPADEVEPEIATGRPEVR